jgi:hypothetical protein
MVGYTSNYTTVLLSLAYNVNLKLVPPHHIASTVL